MLNRDWLEELKIGDQVIVHRYGFGHTYSMGTVVNITQKRRDISVEVKGTKYLFDNRGYDKGRSLGTGYSLLPVTDENIKEMKETNLKRTASYTIAEFRDSLNKLSLEDLVTAYNAIRETNWYKERKQKQGETNV